MYTTHQTTHISKLIMITPINKLKQTSKHETSKTPPQTESENLATWPESCHAKSNLMVI